MFEAIKPHHAAMQKAERLLPLESLLLMMALEQRKGMNEEFTRLLDKLESLSKEVEDLKKNMR